MPDRLRPRSGPDVRDMNMMRTCVTITHTGPLCTDIRALTAVNDYLT